MKISETPNFYGYFFQKKCGEEGNGLFYGGVLSSGAQFIAHRSSKLLCPKDWLATVSNTLFRVC